MDSKELTIFRKIAYAVVLLVASLPLVCAYVMEGGDVLIWLSRIEEIKNGFQSGTVVFYPSAEQATMFANRTSALDTNLWLMFPALLRVSGLDISTVYRIYILLLNALAVFSAWKMFGVLFESKRNVFVGVLLYMTCPYRVYICYDKADFGLIAAWAVLPLLLWGLLVIAQGTAKWQHYSISALAFAGIGYADSNIFVLMLGVALLMLLYYRKWKMCIPMICGGIIYLPGAIYLVRYLLKGGMEVWNLPLQSIAGNGYRFGQFFMSWKYLDNFPGLGLGLLGSLFVLGWLAFAEGNLKIMKKYGVFVIIAAIFWIMSTPIFVWDMAQRVCAPLQRWIALMETPGICFGFVSMAASVLGACGMEAATKQKALFVRVGVPVIVILAALGNCIYLCNMLTYNRMPMFLTDSLF